MKIKQSELESMKIFLKLKDKEIERQIQAKKLAQQTRNWILILFVVVEIVRFFI